MPLWDELEQHFASPETKRRVRELQDQSDHRPGQREQGGERWSAKSSPPCRWRARSAGSYNVSDHGIDMEIEFKDDAGEATGRKLYLQLKSGDSHLHERHE